MTLWLAQSAVCPSQMLSLCNLLIKGYVADSTIERARVIFESLADPVAAPRTTRRLHHLSWSVRTTSRRDISDQQSRG